MKFIQHNRDARSGDARSEDARHASLQFIALAVLATVLLGGCVEDGERPEDVAMEWPADPGGNPVNCSATEGLSFQTIEDFESGAAAGSWYANNDQCEDCQYYVDLRNAIIAGEEEGDLETVELQLTICRQECDANQTPNPFDKPLPADSIAGSRCGSDWALHLQTQPLLDWGANIGNNFGQPIDASGYDGISFWARRSNGSRGVIRIQVGEKHTDSFYDGPEGPACTLDYTEDTTYLGCDGFGAFANVSTDWQLYLLPFAEMRQAGWGVRAPYFDTEGLRNITFLFPTGAWDIWIDDVSFYMEDAQ